MEEENTWLVFMLLEQQCLVVGHKFDSQGMQKNADKMLYPFYFILFYFYTVQVGQHDYHVE